MKTAIGEFASNVISVLLGALLVSILAYSLLKSLCLCCSAFMTGPADNGSPARVSAATPATQGRYRSAALSEQQSTY